MKYIDVLNEDVEFTGEKSREVMFINMGIGIDQYLYYLLIQKKKYYYKKELLIF